MPALALAGAAVASQVLFVTSKPAHREVLWQVTSFIDNWKPIYFATLFAVSFGILLGSYRRTRSLTARKQMKWLVWGTGAGVMPFFLFYAIPFALGREPRQVMELAGYIPLALIPLSLAYAVVKHRLMDVELIFRRTLAYTLAVAAILGISLLTIGLTNVVLADEEPHTTIIALLSTLVVILLFTPVKSRIQDGIDRLFYRQRYSSRKALLRLSQELTADLDLTRTTERLLHGVETALGLESMAVFLPQPDGAFGIFRSFGCPAGADTARLPAHGRGRVVAVGQQIGRRDGHTDGHLELAPQGDHLRHRVIDDDADDVRAAAACRAARPAHPARRRLQRRSIASLPH
jgi:hypothetical protein